MNKTEEKKITDTAMKYRLYCNACTGVAEYTEEKKKGSVICQNCGKRTDRKSESYIQLTKEEKNALSEQGI